MTHTRKLASVEAITDVVKTEAWEALDGNVANEAGCRVPQRITSLGSPC